MDGDRQTTGPDLVQAPFVMVALMVALLAVTLLLWAAYTERLLWPFLAAALGAGAALIAILVFHMVRARRSAGD